MENQKCPHCGENLISLGNKEFQLGVERYFSFIDEHLLQGGIKLELCLCQNCRTVHFMVPRDMSPMDFIDRYGSPDTSGIFFDREFKAQLYRCKKCGHEFDPGLLKCPECGFDLSRPISPMENKELSKDTDRAPKKSKRRMPWEF